VDLMSDSVPELSIIIPSFNEELRLPATLERSRCTSGGEKECRKLSWWTTDPRIALPKWPSLFKKEIAHLRVLANGTNRGQGRISVRHGGR